MRKPGLIIGVIAAIVVSLLLMGTLFAASRSKVEYVGTETCVMCHEDSHGPLIKGHLKTMHHSAMADAVENPNVIVAKFDDTAPFKKDQIRYALGTGKVYQNYLDKDLKVLPGKWDTKAQKWVAAEVKDGVTECIGCHVTNFDPEAKSWTELGVGCESCHGPGGDHSESMDAADIINPKTVDAKMRDMICGQCHAVGTDPTGKFKFSATFVPGQDLAKHFKLVEKIEGVQANAQYNEFIASTHGKGGMKCTSCHEPHGGAKATGPHQLRKPINDQCMTCHKAKVKSLKEHAPTAGANDTCATCHMAGGNHKFGKAEAK